MTLFFRVIILCFKCHSCIYRFLQIPINLKSLWFVTSLFLDILSLSSLTVATQCLDLIDIYKPIVENEKEI